MLDRYNVKIRLRQRVAVWRRWGYSASGVAHAARQELRLNPDGPGILVSVELTSTVLEGRR